MLSLDIYDDLTFMISKRTRSQGQSVWLRTTYIAIYTENNRFLSSHEFDLFVLDKTIEYPAHATSTLPPVCVLLLSPNYTVS